MTIHIQRADGTTLELAAGSGQVGTTQQLTIRPDRVARVRVDAWSARQAHSGVSTGSRGTSTFTLDRADAEALRDWLSGWLNAADPAPTPPAAPGAAPGR